jgi:hypothetical protein
MEKAETLRFPTVKGSGGLGQSLHGEILVGAKELRLRLEWLYCVRCGKFIALWSAIALKCAFSLSHANRVRYECDKGSCYMAQ